MLFFQKEAGLCYIKDNQTRISLRLHENLCDLYRFKLF